MHDSDFTSILRILARLPSVYHITISMRISFLFQSLVVLLSLYVLSFMAISIAWYAGPWRPFIFIVTLNHLLFIFPCIFLLLLPSYILLLAIASSL
jgi:hypothetical protein